MKTINTEIFDQLKAMMGDSTGMLINIFLEDSSKLLEEIQHGIETENTDKINTATHTLKSSAKNMGADKLAHYCSEIEENIKRQEDHSLLLKLHNNSTTEMKKIEETLSNKISTPTL